MPLKRTLAKLLALWMVTNPSQQLCEKLIRINCGGSPKDQGPTIGCFASLGTTRFINYENGIMKGPGGESIIEKAENQNCIFILHMGASVVPGYYQCGTAWATERNKTEYTLFTAFNVSVRGVPRLEEEPKVEVGAPTKSPTTQSRPNEYSGNPHSRSEKDTSFIIIWLILVSLGVGILILTVFTVLMMVKSRNNRRRTWPAAPSATSRPLVHPTPTQKRVTFSLPPPLRDETPTQDIPPPMNLIPADSITRYITKSPSVQKVSCTCLKSPTSSRENFV